MLFDSGLNARVQAKYHEMRNAPEWRGRFSKFGGIRSAKSNVKFMLIAMILSSPSDSDHVRVVNPAFPPEIYARDPGSW